MTITRESLKTNREEIISVLTEEFGVESLRFAMNCILDELEFAEKDKRELTIKEVVENIDNSEVLMHKKSSKMASIQANYCEVTDTKYNHNTRSYEKH